MDRSTGEVVDARSDQNETDRGRLLEQISVDSKFLGLMRSEYTANWKKYVGIGVKEEDAKIANLMDLADFLAGEVTKRKASGAQESVPFYHDRVRRLLPRARPERLAPAHVDAGAGGPPPSVEAGEFQDEVERVPTTAHRVVDAH